MDTFSYYDSHAYAVSAGWGYCAPLVGGFPAPSAVMAGLIGTKWVKHNCIDHVRTFDGAVVRGDDALGLLGHPWRGFNMRLCDTTSARDRRGHRARNNIEDAK